MENLISQNQNKIPPTNEKGDHKLFKSTASFSAMTLLSRITGLVRDLAFASIFGATAGLDAFLVAFRIPNFLRRLFAEGAFSQAFVPILSEYMHDKNPDETKIFINRVAGNLTAVLSFITIIAIICSPLLVWIFAPGFAHDISRYELARKMLQITFPYLLFISLAAYVSGILNCHGSFGVPAFVPNLLNIVLILAATIFAKHFSNPVMALAWGVFFGGIVQLAFQIPFLRKFKMIPSIEFCWKDPGVRRIIKIMLPAVIGVSVGQISLLLDTFFASFLKLGSISWLYYSDRITSFPLGVFGVALSTVILPHLSKKYAARSKEEFSKTIDWAMQLTVIISIPACMIVIFLANPILVTLLKYGHFSQLDVEMTRRSLIAFAFGIPAFMIVKIMASGFYSQQNIKTPVNVAILCVVSNIILNTIIILTTSFGHAGLAFVTSLTSFLNASLLFFNLRKGKFYEPNKNLAKFMLKILFANIPLFIMLTFLNTDATFWIKMNCIPRIGYLGGTLVASIILYFVSLRVLGIRINSALLRL